MTVGQGKERWDHTVQILTVLAKGLLKGDTSWIVHPYRKRVKSFDLQLDGKKSLDLLLNVFGGGNNAKRR